MWSNDESTEIIWKVGMTISSYGGALGQIFFNYDFQSFKPDYVPATWVLNLYSEQDLSLIHIFLLPHVCIFYIMISIINHSTKIQIFNMKYDLE